MRQTGCALGTGVQACALPILASPGRCRSFEALPFKGRVGWGWAFFLPRQNPSQSRPPPSRGQALPLEWEADKQMPSRWGRKNPCCTAIPGVPMKSRLLVLPLALLIAMPSLAATRGFEVRDMVNLDRYSSPALSPDGRRLVFAKRVLEIGRAHV